MLRILSLLVALLVCGCGGGRNLSKVEDVTNVGQLIMVYINNEASGFDGARLDRYIEAQNLQLQRDFRPRMEINVVCVAGKSLGGERTITILDDFSNITRIANVQNIGQAVGFHSSNRTGYVNFLETNRTNRLEEVIGHEVMELATNEHCDPGGLEVCDPVNGYTYEVNGVRLPNFVFRHYYLPGSHGPWDQMGLITAPLRPMPGNVNFLRFH